MREKDGKCAKIILANLVAIKKKKLSIFPPVKGFLVVFTMEKYHF